MKNLYPLLQSSRRYISKVPRSVILSASNDIYVNLALEDWFYRNLDFSQRNLLFLWINNPCVVIGRHQNPWMECNVPINRNLGIQLARRNSGGGTVFHDRGNVNCTFFTKRETYDRKQNLECIVSAIRKLTHCDVSINSRDDIILSSAHKISGTAAKLGRKTAYHHCTILVNVNSSQLRNSLLSKASYFETKATTSLSVPVKNLIDVASNLSVEKLLLSLTQEYLGENDHNPSIVIPTSVNYPGLDTIQYELQSWDWIFGRTPNFKICRTFELPTFSPKPLVLQMTVSKGKIETFSSSYHSKIDLSSMFKDYPFSVDLPELISSKLTSVNEKSCNNLLLICLRQLIMDVA